MVATAGYQLGAEANNVVMSYAQEATYGVLPAVPFQALRMTGESLKGSKDRSRPAEMNTTGESSAATTTKEQAGGGINFALSYGTFDDLLSGMLKSDWSALLSVAGAAGDVSITAGAAGTVRTLSSTTAGKFNGINAGQFFKVAGFTQAGANGFFRALTATGTAITFNNVAATTAETPAGTAAQVRASTILNGTVFKSFHLQKQLGAGAFLRYPGSFVSAATLTGGVGNFLSGSFTFMSQVENTATVDASTGSLIPAPTGRVHDPVAGFGGCFLDDVSVGGLDSFTLNVSAKGAMQEFVMGSSAAQGQIAGLLEVTGNIKLYFKDFSLYQRYKSEVQGALSLVTRDPAGNGYVITLPAATVMNPQILAGSQNTAVMAQFDIEGNPAVPNGTVRIDRLPAA